MWSPYLSASRLSERASRPHGKQCGLKRRLHCASTHPQERTTVASPIRVYRTPHSVRIKVRRGAHVWIRTPLVEQLSRSVKGRETNGHATRFRPIDPREYAIQIDSSGSLDTTRALLRVCL